MHRKSKRDPRRPASGKRPKNTIYFVRGGEVTGKTTAFVTEEMRRKRAELDPAMAPRASAFLP